MAALPPGNVRLREQLMAPWSQSLKDFGTRLALTMGLPAFEYDAENVYEWGQTLTEQGHIEVNISRRYGYVPPASECISVILIISGDAPVEWNKQWVVEVLIPRYAEAIAEITGPDPCPPDSMRFNAWPLAWF